MRFLDTTKKLGTTRAKQGKTFGLIGHFAITAVISIAIAASALGYLYQQSARTNLIENARYNHTEIARLYTKLIWPRFGEFLLETNEKSMNKISSNLQFKDLHNVIAGEISESRLIKVKIFSESGLTIYSSDLDQLGTQKVGYKGFEAAIAGQIYTDLTFREKFNSGSHADVLLDRHVAFSYLPIYANSDKSEIIAVFELYSDMTPLVASILRSRNKMISITVIVMLVLFLTLLWNVIRADRMIKKQEKYQRELKERADWFANHDALTGLPNRRYFNVLLNESLGSSLSSEHSMAVLFIDIDEFKPINDSFGHSVGDQILVELGNKIQAALPESSTIARLGGDEFIAMIEFHNNDFNMSHLTDDIIKAVASPILVGENNFVLSASVGVTWCLESDSNIENIIARADSAMYEAKNGGKNQVRFCSETAQEHRGNLAS